MPDAPAAGTDAQNAGGTATATATTPPPATGDESKLGDAGKRALDAEREAKEAAVRAGKQAQTRVAELEAELKKREDADLSETEKLRKQLADAEAKSTKAEKDRQETLSRAVIEREAAKLRFTDPADAWKLLDAARIDYGTDGTPTNARALLEDLAKAKPYLTGAGKPAPLPGGGATPSSGVSMDDWLRGQARKGRA